MKLSKQKIDVLKARAGLNNYELAKLCDLSDRWLSHVLNRGTARAKTVNKIAKGLGVDVTEIIKTED